MFFKHQNDTKSLNLTNDVDGARALRAFNGKHHRHHEKEF
jgi:hypothetical protein